MKFRVTLTGLRHDSLALAGQASEAQTVESHGAEWQDIEHHGTQHHDTQPRHAEHDVALTVAVTATVWDVAGALVRAGAGDPHLLPIAIHRTAPLTLRMHTVGQPPLILDSGSPIASSGLVSGAVIEPVVEADTLDAAHSRPIAGEVEVVDGLQRGRRFLLRPGSNTIGRARGHRIALHDPGISRTHANIYVTPNGIKLVDLGSVNGMLIAGREVSRVRITEPCTVTLGSVSLRVRAGPPYTAEVEYRSHQPVLSSPQLRPAVDTTPVELPTPPEPARPPRFPLLALIAPLMLGLVLFLTTRSPLSLVFVALSPLIMIGTWIDHRVSGRATERTRTSEYTNRLTDLAETVAAGNRHELHIHTTAFPAAQELLRFPHDNDARLWGRQRDHPDFLVLRCGLGTVPSVRPLVLPRRGAASTDDWQLLEAVGDRLSWIPDSPVTVQAMEAPPSAAHMIGVAGPSEWSAGPLRAMLIQVFAHHSPADISCALFADPEQVQGPWSWLRWIPHIDAVHSPLEVPHIAHDPPGATRLLASLEEEVSRREKSGISFPRILVIVLTPLGDVASPVVDRARLIALASAGATAGIHLLWSAASWRELPANCRSILETTGTPLAVHDTRTGTSTRLTHRDAVTETEAMSFARALAPCIDVSAPIVDTSDFPRSVSLADVAGDDLLSGPDAIQRRWRAHDLRARRPSSSPGPGDGDAHDHASSGLVAVIGQGSREPITIDLRAHGPHALVAGTTGAGKSEFLQTWLLSLATNYAPSRLVFWLVDYKGGAAFAECASLPHTVGLVTDLTPHLVQRALISLRAELGAREALLASKGAKDLATLERRGDPETPPSLLMAIDEFAALTAEVPEFITGIVDVAQRGRSLGLHLILATQRPAGVVTEQVRANTNIRVGLRMADQADSTDVLGVPDAAHVDPQTPGRGAIRFGAGTPIPVQTAYVGGRSDTAREEPVDIVSLGPGPHTPWPLVPEARVAQPNTNASSTDATGTDISVLTAHILAAAEQAGITRPKRPWADPLSSDISLSTLHRTRSDEVLHVSTQRAGDSDRDNERGCIIGVLDEPELQRQRLERIDLAAVGNLSLIGASGSGKTSALVTLACAMLIHSPGTHLYALDAGRGLQSIEQFPNTGAVIGMADHDRVGRLLGMLRQLIHTRQATGPGSHPPVLLLLDGYAAFRTAYEHLGDSNTASADLTEVLRSGRSVGVHVALTAESPGAIPATVAASVQARFVFRLAASADAEVAGVPRGVLDDAPPGRSVRLGRSRTSSAPRSVQRAAQRSVHEVQWAHSTTAVTALSNALAQSASAPAPNVPSVPVRISRTDISRTNLTRHSAGEPSFAIDTVQLQPVAAPDSGIALVTGPAGSGRTTAILSIVEAAADVASEHANTNTIPREACQRTPPLSVTVIAPRRSELRERLSMVPGQLIVADTSDRADAITRLILRFGGTPPTRSSFEPVLTMPASSRASREPASAAESSSDPVETVSLEHRHLIIIIEDIGGFDGTGDEAALTTLLKLLRRSETLTIVEGENATLGSVWELTTALKGSRWALALQPDTHDTPSLFPTPFRHARRDRFPPGRGLLIRDGKTVGVHVATPAVHG